MKVISFLQITGVLILVIAWSTACVSQKELDSYSDIRAKSEQEESDTSFQELPEKASEVEPPLYHFISNSDYVVSAWVAEKKPKGSTAKDLFSGEIYTFRIEKIHYVKHGSKESSGNENALKEFQIYSPGGLDSKDPSYFYSAGHRYLIFLQKQPEVEKYIKKYDLPTRKTYYKAFRSETTGLSFSPSIGATGIIDLTDPKYQPLVQRIDEFCEVINEPNKNAKLKKLRQLADSEDRVLQRNAVYALGLLETEQ